MLENIVNNLTFLMWNILMWPVIILIIVAVVKHMPNILKMKQKKRSILDDKNALVISLGSKVGTGAIIGIMGSLTMLVANNEMIEALIFWVAIGALLFLPLTYVETAVSRNMHKTPREYIAHALGSSAGKVYAISLIILYAFGFTGFQFMGIQTSTQVVLSNVAGIQLGSLSQFIFLIMPVLIFVMYIVNSGQVQKYINTMSLLVMIMIVVYVIYFVIFMIQTVDYIPLFIHNFKNSITNSFAIMTGIPFGFMMAMQRIMQSSEAGLGTSPLSATETNFNPRNAAKIQVIATAITLLVGVGFITYITSVGVHQGNIDLTFMNGSQRILGLYATVNDVSGILGSSVLFMFFTISGITTIMGGYHFIKVLFKEWTPYKIKLIYFIAIILAGVFSVINFEIVFDVVDLATLMLVTINVIALLIINKQECRHQE